MVAPDPVHVISAVEHLRETYQEAELRLLRIVARRLQRGITTPGWAERKLAEMSLLNRDLARIISGLNSFTVEELGRLVEAASERGRASATEVLRVGRVGPLEGAFTRISPTAIQALYAQTVGQISSSNLRILRATLDAYRAIVSQASMFGVTGVETRREVSQRMLDQWAKNGLTGFTDTLGRRWEMSAYAEMSSRSAITRSFIQGRLDRFQDYTDLVRIDDTPEECSLCRPLEGKIFSQSGRDLNWPALSSAISQGLFHPNCTHSVAPYFEDTGKTLYDGPRQVSSDPQAYEDREYQRYLERNTRAWKRREAIAEPGSPQERAARAKVREWQARTRQFTNETGRRRLYDRESITATGRRSA